MATGNNKKPIVFVTGKGGVGKSTIAGWIAQKKARDGQNTLLVELGEISYFQSIYNTPIQYEPTRVNGFSVAMWSGENCLREYVLYLIKIKKIVDLFFNNRVMRAFVRAAPALRELAVLGKITSGIRRWGPPLEYDCIVVDGLSTGHFLAMLSAPEGMGELIQAGPMGEQSRNIMEVLKTKAEYVIVTTLEEMSTTEAMELSSELINKYGVSPRIVCNKVIDFQTTSSEWEKFAEKTDSGTNEYRAAAEIVKMMARQELELSRLTAGGGQVLIVPFVFTPKPEEVLAELKSVDYD